MIKHFKCLVVDDEPLAIDVIENYLQRLNNVETTRCENAIEALRLLKNESFDLIFLDIEMPLLTGLDLLGTIKTRRLLLSQRHTGIMPWRVSNSKCWTI